MRIPGIHEPDPNHPLGMAWWFAAGVVDPRPGGYPKKLYPNQQWCVKQCWEPTSQLMWDLGFRWHPELQKVWLEGGGQFQVAEIVDKPPIEPSFEEQVQEFAEDQFRQMKAEVERVLKEGTEFEKRRLRQRFQLGMQQSQQLAAMIEDATQNIPDDKNMDKEGK